MSFTKIKSSQNKFLETYLRGTNKSLTESQARALYGIKNLRARMTELRHVGLRVSRIKTDTHRTAYRISRRDVNGSQAKHYK